jgi:glycosyltransferase involved in cell wall biosynthesis
MVFDARRSSDESRALRQLRQISDGAVEFERIDAGASRADGLAMLREAAAVLVLCSHRTALVEDLRWIAQEAQRAGAPVVGFVSEA